MDKSCCIDAYIEMGEPVEEMKEGIKKAEGQLTCCECDGLILKGSQYHEIVGMILGYGAVISTCIGCYRLREQLYCSTVPVGSLAADVRDAYGTDIGWHEESDV